VEKSGRRLSTDRREGGGGPKLEQVLMEGACGSLLARNGIIFPIILDSFQVTGP
jgi:hypothetical protein